MSSDFEGEPISDLKKILFLVRDDSTPVNSYTWRIWPAGTSFYIKSTAPGFTDMKLSLHGPRPENPGPGPWLKIGRDSSVDGNSGLTVGRWNLPIWFAGHEIQPNVRHCVRFRFDWTMFRTGVPSGPNPGDVKQPNRSQSGVVRHAPSHGRALDVDLFISTDRPRWPEESRVKLANAMLGPLHNKSGQWLTGEIHERDLSQSPTWHQAAAPILAGTAIVTRGLGVAVDSEQVLWVNEVALNQVDMAVVDRMDQESAKAAITRIPAGFQSRGVPHEVAVVDTRFGFTTCNVVRDLNQESAGAR